MLRKCSPTTRGIKIACLLVGLSRGGNQIQNRTLQRPDGCVEQRIVRNGGALCSTSFYDYWLAGAPIGAPTARSKKSSTIRPPSRTDRALDHERPLRVYWLGESYDGACGGVFTYYATATGPASAARPVSRRRRQGKPKPASSWPRPTPATICRTSCAPLLRAPSPMRRPSRRWRSPAHRSRHCRVSTPAREATLPQEPRRLRRRVPNRLHPQSLRKRRRHRLLHSLRQ